MKAVYEYLLNSHTVGKQTIYLPRGAEVITAKNTENGFLLYVLASSAEPYVELRTFQICTTAGLISDDNIRYIASCDVEGCLLHVFEVL